MDTSILKYIAFLKTVRCGRFTYTSEMLGYSQSGISRMIRDLDRDWEVVFMDRGPQRVCLTSDGTKLIEHVKAVCTEYHKLQVKIDEVNGLQSGIIRIGTFSSVATHWLPQIIKEFQKDFPGIDYELLLGDYTEIEQWITEGRVDCGFIRIPTKQEFEVIELYNDRLLAVIPEAHPLDRKSVV